MADKNHSTLGVEADFTVFVVEFGELWIWPEPCETAAWVASGVRTPFSRAFWGVVLNKLHADRKNSRDRASRSLEDQPELIGTTAVCLYFKIR